MILNTNAHSLLTSDLSVGRVINVLVQRIHNIIPDKIIGCSTKTSRNISMSVVTIMKHQNILEINNTKKRKKKTNKLIKIILILKTFMR